MTANAPSHPVATTPPATKMRYRGINRWSGEGKLFYERPLPEKVEGFDGVDELWRAQKLSPTIRVAALKRLATGTTNGRRYMRHALGEWLEAGCPDDIDAIKDFYGDPLAALVSAAASQQSEDEYVDPSDRDIAFYERACKRFVDAFQAFEPSRMTSLTDHDRLGNLELVRFVAWLVHMRRCLHATMHCEPTPEEGERPAKRVRSELSVQARALSDAAMKCVGIEGVTEGAFVAQCSLDISLFAFHTLDPAVARFAVKKSLRDARAFDRNLQQVRAAGVGNPMFPDAKVTSKVTQSFVDAMVVICKASRFNAWLSLRVYAQLTRKLRKQEKLA